MSTKRKISLSSPQPVKKERKTIDLVTKMKVIKQHEGGKKVNMIARDLKLSHSTVSTILKDKERIRGAVKGSAPMQSTVITKQRTGPIHEMEKLLNMWMEDQIQKRTPLSLFTVQTKAKSLFQTLKDRAGDDYTQDFVASTGWFARFKKRFQLHNVRVTGEAASADEEGAHEPCVDDDLESRDSTTPVPAKDTAGGPYLLKKATHAQTILHQLMDDEMYADVTLTAEGQNIKGHRIVLSLASDYFRSVLSSNSVEKNAIFFSEMKFSELKNIITFIYTGEVTLSAEDLESFMKTAAKLGISSLKEGSQKVNNLLKNSSPPPSPKPNKKKRKKNEIPENVHNSNSQSSSIAEPQLLISEADIKSEQESEGSPAPTLEPVIHMEVDKEPIIPRCPSGPSPMGSPMSTDVSNPGSSVLSSASLQLPKSGRCPYCSDSSLELSGEALQRHMDENHSTLTAFTCVPCSLVYVRHEWYLEHLKVCKHFIPSNKIKEELLS